MGSRPNKINSITIPADMLEKIAAINHLAVADVVQLFLKEALAAEASKLGTLERSAPIPRRLACQNKALPARAS
jgi:hypothetical protein